MSNRAGHLVPIALAAAALGLASCGGDDSSGKRSPRFAKADLSELVVGRNEAPAGTTYLKRSGPQLLEREGGREKMLDRLRRLGFVTDYGSQFEPTRREGAWIEALALLFRSAHAAGEGLNYLEDVHHREFRPARDLPSVGLGTASFGLRESFQRTPVFVYAWRTGNVVQIATHTGSAAATRHLARRLEHLASQSAHGGRQTKEEA